MHVIEHSVDGTENIVAYQETCTVKSPNIFAANKVRAPSSACSEPRGVCTIIALIGICSLCYYYMLSSNGEKNFQLSVKTVVIEVFLCHLRGGGS